MSKSKGRVAVVGRANVGKTSLVNRLAGAKGIVESRPGVTRDRVAYPLSWGGREFDLVDSGGLGVSEGGLEAGVGEQALAAAREADLVLLVVDARTGLQEDDERAARRLRGFAKPVIVVANKVDDDKLESEALDAYGLGFGTPSMVSAVTGRGTGDLLDRVASLLPSEEVKGDKPWAKVAIVGRPNAGKSSILNRLVGSPRAIVHPSPGTTRDPVDEDWALSQTRVVRLVDTAGIRRKAKIRESLDYYALLRSRRALARADAALLVIDGSQGVTGSDQRIARDIVDRGAACVVVVNKVDLLDGEAREGLERSLRSRLRFLEWAEVVKVSALTGRGIKAIPPALERAILSHRRRLETGAVNRMIERAKLEHPPSRQESKPVRILYATQAEVSPPGFVVFATGRIDVSYLRYLERSIRNVEPFVGTPIRIHARIRQRENAVSKSS